MAADDSDLLPKPPPPRPDRRDAAIEAALRRFDGGEAPPGPAPVRPRASWWAWSARPQFALAMTACLVAVIGLPAAFIVIRDGNSPVFQAPPPPPAATSRREGVPQGVTAVQSAEPPVASAVPPPATAASPAQRQDSGAMATTDKLADELAATESPAMEYAAPPPPPPPPPPPAAPMLAQKSIAEGVASGVVVTGSRIPQPNPTAKRDSLSRETSRAEVADARTAPDWVLKDRAYAAFLTQLQTAVRKNDRGAVIKLIAFPLRVNSGGRSQVYRDARSVRRDYDQIFTPSVTRAILNQRFDRLFGRDLGVMIGDGQVWFDYTCPNAKCPPPGPVRITAINR